MRRFRDIARGALPKGKFGREVSILAGGTAISQALAALASPLLTRIYRVEDFGYFQIYTSVLMFGALAVTLRYEQAILLPEHDEQAANVVILTLFVVGILSVFSGCMAWLMERYDLLPSSAQGLRKYLWIIPVGVTAAGIYQTLSFWALRKKAYTRVTRTKVGQVFTQLSTQTGMGLFHFGAVGLLLGDAVGRATGIANLARLTWQSHSGAFRSVSWRSMRASAVRYRDFPLISTASALLGVAAGTIPPLLIAQFYGPKTLGWFALGDRILGAPTLLVGQAVSQVYSVELASLSATNPHGLLSLFLRSTKRLALFGLVPLIFFLFFSPVVFGFVFGESWREAGVYARLLAPMRYLGFICWPLTPTLYLLEHQSWQLAWDAGRLVITLAALWIIYHLGYSARTAIGGFGGTLLLSYVVHFLLSYWAIKRRIREFCLTTNGQVSTAVFAESGKL